MIQLRFPGSCCLRRAMSLGLAPLFLVTVVFAADTADSVATGSPGGISVGGGLLSRPSASTNPLSQPVPVTASGPSAPARPSPPLVPTGTPPNDPAGPASRPAQDSTPTGSHP